MSPNPADDRPSRATPDLGSSNGSTLEDRRQSARRPVNGALRVVLETAQFGGDAENISPAGVFFFSTDELRVRVEVEEDGQPKTYRGRLARVARMSDEETGYAIEFDRE